MKTVETLEYLGPLARTIWIEKLFEVVMSEKSASKKKWVPPSHGISGSVENGVLEKIGALLKEESIEDISQFLSKGFANQAIQSWSYFAQVNDHRKFTNATITISKLLSFISSNNELQEHGVEIIKEILTNYIKTIYRGLNSMRASLTNPIIRLVNEIACFKHGALIDDFVALFDFTLPVLPKLLVPSKTELANVETTKQNEHLSMRYCFIRLLLNLLKYSAPLLRKDLLLNNNKIIINWFKYICVVDSNELISLTISTWDEKIIKEQSFKKATKIKVFNDWNLTKILPIYYTADKELRVMFDKFIVSLATDKKYGIRFNDDESWFLQNAGTGTISVNGKSFKTHNKLLYSLVTSLKPWDDDLQLTTTIQILKSVPELIPPFMNYLASRGLHDPKLSSYWLGQTLLLSKVISLEIPEDIVSHDTPVSPSTNVIIELVVPSVLNRSVLAKCLLSDSFLIRQLSAQLIINSLQKLESLLKLYSKKSWDEQRIQLLNKARLCLPELSTVINSLTDAYNKKSENKILLLTLLSVVNGYMKHFSETLNFSQHLSKPYSDIINGKEFESIDFVLLDNFFQLQEGDNSQIKWWNKSDQSTSLFTSLLKLSSSNNPATSAVTTKITKLLSSLVKQTVIFNVDIAKADQIELLVHSLQLITSSDDVDELQLEKIWKLLDESVSRCVRSPFKYLDASNDLGKVSPLLITIFEQWKFVNKETPYDIVSNWFAVYLRLLIIGGEPLSSITKLLETIEANQDIIKYLPSDSYEKNLHSLATDGILEVEPESSFLDIITTAPMNKLQSISKIPISHVDIVGALFRLSQFAKDDSLKLKERGLEKIIIDVLSKIGNYLIVDTEAAKELSKEKYWRDLFANRIDNEKKAFILSNLAEIFSQLPGFETTSFNRVVKDLLHTEEMSAHNETVIAACIWALDSEDLLQVLNKESLLLKQETLSLLLDRKVKLSSSEVALLLEEPALSHYLESFIRRKLVIFDNVGELFVAASKDSTRFSFLRLLAQEADIVFALLDFIVSQNKPSLIACVSSSLPSDVVANISDDSGVKQLIEDAKLYAVEHIKSEDFEEISFAQLLHIFYHPFVEVSEEEKSVILEYALTKHNNKYISEIAQIIERFQSFDNEIVKTWLNKSILFMTKVFSEAKTLPTSFINFLRSFKSLILKSHSAQIAKKINLNTLLEVIFTRWSADETALEFASMVVVVASKASLETNKLLQIFVSNDDMVLAKSNSGNSKSRFLGALILWRLFEFDVSKNSSITLQEKVLTLYNGTNNAADLLLFKVLEKIETRLNSSWVDFVYTWDFLDSLTEEESELIGETKLIEKKKEGLIITLNKNQITNTVKNYNILDLEPPSLNSSGITNWNKIESFYETVETSSSRKETYNPLFLSLLIINNDELITTEGEENLPKANLRKLIESDIFAFILMNLSSDSEKLVNVTLNILSSILYSLKTNSTFKDKHIFELFLSKILYTFKKTDESGERTNPKAFSPLVYSTISRLSTILVNPGHFLYEKAFRWVLKSPSLRTNEIPLFNEIITLTVTNDDATNYYKQLSWLIEGFSLGIKNKEDVKLLRNKNVFEWILNLESSPYITTSLKFSILDFIKAVQNVEEGADILITRYAGLSNLEQQISTNESQAELIHTTNYESVKLQQELLNLKQLGLRFAMIGQGKKRVADWTQDDLKSFTKRIHCHK